MKNILILILIVFGLKGFSQITYTPMIASGYQITYLKTDSGFALPLRDTTIGRGINRAGALVVRAADNLPYYYNGTNWVLLGTSGGLVPDVTLQDAFDNDPTALPKINAHNQSFNVDSAIGITLSSRSNSISGKIGQVALSAGTFSLQNSTPQVGGTFGSTVSSADSLLVGLSKNNDNETRFRLSPSDFLVSRLGGSYKSIGTSINGDPFDETGNIEIPNVDTTSLSNRINLKQNLITLTTTGTSGASTFNQGTGALNIPNYAAGITGVGNIGTGHRIITTSGTNAKTLFPGVGIAIDSSSNTNGLTFKLDTTFGKKYFTYGLLVPNDSTVTLDKTIAVTYDTSITAYKFLGQASGTGIPSWQSSMDSNWIPTLHSEGYYNTKYFGTLSKNASRDSIVLTYPGGFRTAAPDSIGGGGVNYWTLTGNDIYNNNNSGNGFVGVGTIAAPGSKFQVKYNTVNTLPVTYSSADTTKGASLINDQPATVGQNQYSPLLRFRGSGWSTNSGGATKRVEWRMYGHAVTGAAVPTSSLFIENSIDGGNWGGQFQLSQAGLITISGGLTASGNVTGASIQTSVAGIFSTAKAPGAAQADGILMNNSTNATVGTPVQRSPSMRQISTAWDGTSAFYYNEFFQDVRGVNGTIPTTSAYWWSTRTSTTATGAITDLLSLNNKGKFTFLNTVTAGGTTGAQTIDKASGTVNFAAAATTLVVTNALVTASSIVFAVVRTADATAYIKSVVPGAGSFTITLGAAATAETSVGFWVIN